MIKALYRRGIARKETGQLLAAQKGNLDFTAILSKDPDNINPKATPAADASVPRFILHLAIDEIVDTHGDILSRLRTLTNVTTVKVAHEAQPLPRPRVSEKQHAPLLAQLVAYVKAGGTVVIGCAFSSFMSGTEMTAFFNKGWGLPWKMSAYHRTTFALNQQNPLAATTSALQKSYSMKAGHFFERCGGQGGAVPVVFAEVGRGWLGYVGDVNSEKGSTEAIVAMFGLQNK
ncbi:hypothetical protein C8F04DRAFT_1230121 [Mycena alexandri]|uniref:Uncharacterized protein n=1 Tax=Mycena alexandri TaxID=1745969 RepID=A0AAD6XBK9_9AGAR|nr:hypothetical protein C8F04DRAFT_1230121 [Mycena alexandri]